MCNLHARRGEAKRGNIRKSMPHSSGSLLSSSLLLLRFSDLRAMCQGSLGDLRRRTCFNPYQRGPVFLQADPLGGGTREINDPPLGMRPPIINLDLHRLAGLQVRDLCRRPQRQRRVGGRELLLVKAFPAGRLFALVRGPIPGGFPHLLDSGCNQAGGQHSRSSLLGGCESTLPISQEQRENDANSPDIGTTCASSGHRLSSSGAVSSLSILSRSPLASAQPSCLLWGGERTVIPASALFFTLHSA